MCTVVLLLRPGHAWPVLLAANRDERLDRAWLPPAAHWAERPGVVGGRDVLGGGTWLAVSARGVVAAVLNRTGSLGPAAGKRSRGALPLLALDHPTAEAAVAAILDRDLADYRSFNLVLADRRGAAVICADGDSTARTIRLDPGTHVVTARDPDEPGDARVVRHRPRFAAAAPPEPPDWAAWTRLLGDRAGVPGAALTVPPRDGFGTVCASLVAIPADPAAPPAPWFAPGPADRAAFVPVPVGQPSAGLL